MLLEVDKSPHYMNRIVLELYKEELEEEFTVIIGKYGIINYAEKGVRSALIEIASMMHNKDKDVFLLERILDTPLKEMHTFTFRLSVETETVGIQDGIIIGQPNEKQKETIEWLQNKNYF